MTDEEHTNKMAAIRDDIKSIVGFDSGLLTAHGKFSFERPAERLIVVKKLIENLLPVLPALPRPHLNDIYTRLRSFSGYLKKIAEFDPMRTTPPGQPAPNPRQEREGIIDAVETEYSQLLPILWAPSLQAGLDPLS